MYYIPAKHTGFPGIIPGFSVSSRYPGISVSIPGFSVSAQYPGISAKCTGESGINGGGGFQRLPKFRNYHLAALARARHVTCAQYSAVSEEVGQG